MFSAGYGFLFLPEPFEEEERQATGREVKALLAGKMMSRSAGVGIERMIKRRILATTFVKKHLVKEVFF